MRRPIDADALKKQIEDFHCKNCDNYNFVRCRACSIDYAVSYLDEAPTVGGWISVKDKLPELKRFDEDGDTWLMSSPVLVATNKGVTIGYYEDDLDPKFKPCWNDREHGEKIKVTHWMELPERPKK